MKLLITDKELAEFLYEFIGLDTPRLKNIKLKTDFMAAIIDYICREKNKRGFNVDKMRDKFKEKIRKSVIQDLKIWQKEIELEISVQREDRRRYTHNHLNYFIEKLGEDKILQLYRNYKKDSFVKSTGFHIDQNAELQRRKDYTDYTKNCLFRNMQGNEEMLLHKINNNLPFWFIDTGYTNFISGKGKKWHRLTKNHLHHIKEFTAPVDRLAAFESFPQQWRNSGEKILIIEPGDFSAKTFNLNVNDWKIWVESEIRKYSDKKIVFRSKLSKKVRKSLYNELCDDDYYCIVNISSNAAIESIWAGIPAITLSDHISNPVTSRSISDINNLAKPHLANWLCMLSYSQFTYEELVNGTAARIVKQYHA